MRGASNSLKPSKSPEKSGANEINYEPPKAQNIFPVVGIGASAGGLEAFTQLLSHLPVNTGMAFVLVQHLDPDHQSHLTNLLAKATTMPVREVKDGMVIKPDQVFVIPPNVNMGIAGGKLKLTPRDGTSIPHLPVNFLFRSLAREQQSWAIGVILSGTGSDGAIGLAEIKDVGGITFAQDEKSAKFTGMPVHAAHGHVDFVLSPQKIAQELTRIGHDPYVVLPAKTESEEKQAEIAKHFRRILAILRSQTNLDLSRYRDTTIKRRIQRRMVVNSQNTLAGYIKFLEKDANEVKALFDDVLINVTSFFRDAELFEVLKSKAFPEILKNAPQVIRIWVAACSTGQEAYSLAITLLEFLEHVSNPPAIQIFATDINEGVSIEKARRGFFSESIKNEVSPERLERYFTKEENGYRISKTIRDLCIFAKQNIGVDPPFSRMDLISCRNLLIYFTPDLQRHVISMFHYALNQNGFLVLGSSEAVGANADMFEPMDRKYKIFSKKGMATRPFSHFTAEDLKPGALPSARTKAPYAPGTTDFQKEADRVLLGRFAPAAVLINSNLEVLQFRGRTSQYLEQPTGPASFNLLKMARDNLPLELGKAIQEARQQNVSVRRDVHLQDNSIVRKITLEIVPLKLAGSSENCFLVLFEEAGKSLGDSERSLRRKREIADKKKPVAEKDRELIQIRRELVDAREYLQAVIEQHDASNEELKCANEEVLSSNEELQSTNEQLSTAKEELQSTNEELVTLNEELQTRNAELTHLNNEFKAANEKLLNEKTARRLAEAASHAKDEFLAILSHELRTPLNPVLLLASDAAKNRDLPPGVRADFETIRKNIESEARLIDDLLDLSSISFQKLNLERQFIDTHQILRDAAASMKSELKKKQIELNLKLDSKQHIIHCDPVRLQQVFFNLLKNAVKFTSEHGKITIETSLSTNKKKLQIKISDTGFGMTPEELERIFLPFSQGDHAANSTHQFGGLGLGLTISRKLVELHSGTIQGASAGRNHGSTFTIELPLASSDKEVSRSAAKAKLMPGKTRPGGQRILLVEDHEPTRNALKLLLIRRKYKVTTAASVAEALGISDKETFDLLISDIGLPDGNGNDLMLKLHGRYSLKGIALTGYGMKEDVSRALASGFLTHLTKPVSIQSLENALSNL